MHIEIGAPASLPFGLVQLESGAGPKTCLLGVTLQHPPVNLFAQAYPAGLKVSGARADVAYTQAARFLGYHGLKQQAEVEIELAIPSLVGLGSEAMLGLSMAQALAWLNNLPLDDAPALARASRLPPQEALALWGFAQGGVLLVDVSEAADLHSPPLRRFELAHSDKEAWVFVLVLPRIPPGAPETLEADRLAGLLKAAPHLSAETEQVLTTALWPALESDDMAAFGRAVMALQALNQAALTSAGVPLAYTPGEQAIFDLMRDHGAMAWGRSATGLALFGLVKGARASIDLRHKLRHHLGFFGGRAMASITDNRGAMYALKAYGLEEGRYKPFQMKSP
jgi:predicted sugar kinase